ncbi:MAG: trypsin-like serine protease, partial [Verrucomicrobia bacterium]|nr:trypsin-like serine protease [Verrucomicrobiota bacterium]
MSNRSLIDFENWARRHLEKSEFWAHHGQKITLSVLCLCFFLEFGYQQKLFANDEVRRDATVRAVEKVMPSVVNIRTEILIERKDFYYDLLWEYFGSYYRGRPAESTYSLGSGVIIHESGYVLTNAHVINRASRVEVILQDGTRYDAEPIAGMRSSDVALLRIRDEKPLPKFQSIGFASEGDLMLGETVIALGNPFGLGSSVSRGILSSKNRRPPMDDEPLEIEDWLQTDAAINPGNSGGPLINLAGEMIGLNVAVFKEGQGIGFAIPVKRVNDAIGEIMTPEVLDGLWFGAKVKAGTIPLVVSEVVDASPASEAGLRIGDDILRLNGLEVDHIVDFYQSLTESKGKEPLKLDVDRNG